MRQFAAAKHVRNFLLGVCLLAALLVAVYLAWNRRAASALVVRPSPNKPGRFYTGFEVMGTEARLEAAARDAESARLMFELAVEQIRTVERLMSSFREGSDVSRLNLLGASRAVNLSPKTYFVLQQAVQFSNQTSGAFDVTYTPLGRLWRKAAEQNALPSQADIEQALGLVGSRGLILKGGSARLAAEGMEVDLGGIAKGYALDLAAEAMVLGGATSALVDIGGDLRLVGRREDGQPWKLKVRTPPGVEQPQPIYLWVSDVAVATSGDYARFFTVGKKRFSHIVDPRTGWPVADVPSVTIVAPDGLTADALATAASVLGPEEALELIGVLDGVEGMIMQRAADGHVRTFYSRGFTELLEEPSQ